MEPDNQIEVASSNAMRRFERHITFKEEWKHGRWFIGVPFAYEHPLTENLRRLLLKQATRLFFRNVIACLCLPIWLFLLVAIFNVGKLAPQSELLSNALMVLAVVWVSLALPILLCKMIDWYKERQYCLRDAGRGRLLRFVGTIDPEYYPGEADGSLIYHLLASPRWKRVFGIVRIDVDDLAHATGEMTLDVLSESLRVVTIKETDVLRQQLRGEIREKLPVNRPRFDHRNFEYSDVAYFRDCSDDSLDSPDDEKNRL